MKKTFKILIILSLSLTSLFAVKSYYSNQFLFNLTESETPLTQDQMESLKTPYPQLNRMIKKLDVVRIEPWLQNARDEDRDGEVYLNRIYRMVTSADQVAPLAIANEIASTSNGIMNAEPEAIMRKTSSIPNDTRIGDQWYLTKAKVKEAWKLWDLEAGEIPGNRNIVVAVVDDGVEYTHPDLWKNIWINQDEIPSTYFSLIDKDLDLFITAEELVTFSGDMNGDGKSDLQDVLSSNSLVTDGIDNDNDGYADNIIGWDFHESGNDSDDDINPMVINNSHGTHVAGLVGATTNNGKGVASAAYNISIMAVKATGDETTTSINTGWDGILFAAQAGADIINCSWGGPGYSSYAQSMINTLKNTYDVLFVAAAGNGDDAGNPSSIPHYPSGYDHVVSVTALSSSDEFSWANYGFASGNFYGIDISAPGENMLSTYITKESSYASLNGTSMASPFVASCFALMKSVYPDSSNDWLVDRLLNNTDPIDDINPEYVGQLGSGRVNLLKALAFDKLPYLSLYEQHEIMTNGDGDSILNPGEIVNLYVDLKNHPGWLDAFDVHGVLTCSDENIIILDSLASWTLIPSDSSVINSGDGFSVKISDNADVKTYEMQIKIISNETNPYAYRTTIPLDLSVCLNQKGFPYQANTEVTISPVSIDINSNGYEEIIFVDKSGGLYVLDKNGEDVEGFPINFNSQPGGVAVADIDLDDTLEIVVSLFDKKIQVYDVTGKYEWTGHSSNFILAMPAIGNIDDDDELEVIVGSYDKNIYAFNHDSTDVLGFPYNSGELLFSGVSLADIDNDGKDEIFYPTKSGKVGYYNTDTTQISGWPVSTSGSIVSEPQVILGDDNSAVVLIGNDNGDMYGFNLDGSQRFMVNGTGAIKASPAIYVNSGEASAFFASTTGNIYKIDLNNGVLEDGWPKEFPTQFYNSLVIADFSNDPLNESCVVGMGNNGKLYMIDVAGNPVDNQSFPLNTGFLSKSGLAVSDIDNDGDNEIITGTFNGLSVIDIKRDAGNIFWPMHRGNAKRQGAVKYLLTSIENENIISEESFDLLGNYPNPFNPTTSIRFNLPKISSVTLKIFSLTGKVIVNESHQFLNAGQNEFSVDMGNFASGIYIYSIEVGDAVKNAKMILMK